MSLSPQDAQAIAGTAQRLGVDPRTLGALMEMESGLDPNIWGGGGGKYRGLIQFGPGARKEVGLPEGPMTIAQQMPYVEKYFQQRGFQPGKHGTTELYRTVLVGNPNQSGTDSFGTNSDAAAKRMMPGGDLYQRFSGKFDPVAGQVGRSSGGASELLAQAGADGETADLLDAILNPAGAGKLDPLSAASVIGVNRFAGGKQFAQGLAELDPGILAVQAMFGSPRQQLAEPASNAGAISGSGERESVPGYDQGVLKPIEYLTGDPSHAGYRADHGGGNYHEHLAFATTGQRDAAMAKLKAAGIQIGSVNDGKHAPGSYHYQDLAFDIPAAQVPVGQEQALSRRVRAILGMT